MAKDGPNLIDEIASRPSVRDYALLTAAALLVIGVLLVEARAGWWAVLVVLIGLGGILGRWVAAPPLVMLGTLSVLQMTRWGAPTGGSSGVLLALALLVYVAAHLRLLTLVSHAVPPDRRRNRPDSSRLVGRWVLPEPAPRRTVGPPVVAEMGRLIAAAVGFAVVAYLLWVRLALERPPDFIEVPRPVWHGLVLLWTLGLLLLLARVFLLYLRRALAGRDASLLYLQDQLWQATRGEGRRIWRWFTAGRLRREKKEGSR